MKINLVVALVISSGALCGCASGDLSGRRDYADPQFASRASQLSAREAELRKLYPTLSDEQIRQKLAVGSFGAAKP